MTTMDSETKPTAGPFEVWAPDGVYIQAAGRDICVMTPVSHDLANPSAEDLANAHMLVKAHAEMMAREGLETPRMLVLSTKHISEKTAGKIDLGLGHLPAGIARRDNGWIIPIYDGWDNEAEDQLVPRDLAAIRDFAVPIGCTWICLDSDGDILTGLPTYDW